MDTRNKLVRQIDELCQWLPDMAVKRIETLVWVIDESQAGYDDKLDALRAVRYLAENVPMTTRAIREADEARDA